MDAAPKRDRIRPIAPFAIAMVGSCLAVLGVCAALAPAALKGIILAGGLASFLAGCAALAGVAVGIKHGTNGLLAGFTVGFFARAIAVAIGLIVSGAQGRSALIYVASFFGFYAVTQAIEIAYVWSSSRGQGALAKGLMERSTS